MFADKQPTHSVSYTAEFEAQLSHGSLYDRPGFHGSDHCDEAKHSETLLLVGPSRVFWVLKHFIPK